jgi:hypothetical protein
MRDVDHRDRGAGSIPTEELLKGIRAQAEGVIAAGQEQSAIVFVRQGDGTMAIRGVAMVPPEDRPPIFLEWIRQGAQELILIDEVWLRETPSGPAIHEAVMVLHMRPDGDFGYYGLIAEVEKRRQIVRWEVGSSPTAGAATALVGHIPRIQGLFERARADTN